METDVHETDFEETENKFVQADISDSKVEDDSQQAYNPIDVVNRQNLKFCRICLQSEPLSTSENMVNLFSPLNANIRINEALAICVGLEVFQNNHIPFTNEICMDCINQLRATYNFRKLCWASEYELKSNGLNFQLEDQKNDGKANRVSKKSLVFGENCKYRRF